MAVLLVSAGTGAGAVGFGRTTPAATNAVPLRQEPRTERRFDHKTLVVKFRSGVAAAERQDAARAHGARLLRSLRGTRLSLLAVGDAEKAGAALRGDPRVASVELNYTRYALATPNDPRFATEQQYLLPLRVPAAWDLSRGSTAVKIAIADTGVDLDHPDLDARILPGYDFVNRDAAAQDDEGHGTMVAGIAAASTDNGIGVAGVAWNASIIPVKVLDNTGSGYDFDIANGITWAADNGAQVINLSLGSPWSSSTLYDAIDYARRKGAVVVAAAGNDGAAVLSVPGAYADVAVAATDGAGDAAWFSNSGYWVDLAAPGIDVTSTALAPGPAEAYARGAGTSFASPIVAGVAALVRAQHPDWAQADVVKQLLRGWDRGPRGLDPFYGLGLVDAYAAVGAAAQSAAPQPGGDANEPNGAPKRATVVTTSASGTISPEGDEDVFAVDVTAPKWFSATVTPPTLSPTVRAIETDPRIDAIGPGGQHLRLGAGVENTPGRREAVLVPAAVAGRYYLDVSSMASSRGSYSLAVTDARAPALFEDEQWRSFPGVEYLRDLKLADITGDGRNDVLSAVADKLMLLPQQAAGGLGQPQWFPIDQGWSYGISTGDFDGDGAKDVAVATMAGPQIFYARAGSLAAGPVLGQPSPPRDVAIADMDGDSRADVVTLGDDTQIRIFMNAGGSTFNVTTVSPSADWRLAVGDLTNDGRPDIAGCASGFAGIDVYEQNATGDFARRRYDAWCGDDIVLADMTGDGRTDLVTNGFRTQVFAQTTAGTLADPDTFSGLSEGYLAAGDLNADGRADLTEIAHNSCYFRQLSQLPNGLLALATEDCRAKYWDGPMAIGDVTGDGKADVVLAQNGGTLVTFPHAASDAPRPPEPAEFWVENVTPTDFSLDVPVATEPALDFGSDLAMHDGASLVSGLTGREAPSVQRYDHSTLSTTVRPATGLAPGTPYLLAQEPQYYNESFRLSGAQGSYRFATAGTPDTSAPDTTVTGDPEYWTAPSTPVFTFTASKLGSMFECSLDAVGFYPCASPRTYDSIEPGAHTFRVRALDVAGRIDSTPATVTWTVPAPTAGVPEYDAFANAAGLRAGGDTFSINNFGATKEPGEPNHAGNVGGHSLWVRWRAPRSGTLTLETRGSTIDTLLAVYTGTSVSALTSVASNDNVSASDTTSKVTFSVNAGTTYRIAIDGKNGATGYVSFTYNAVLAAPANDNFANRETITGSSGTIYASNVGATSEAGEPDSEFFPQPKSIWYRWTAPRSGLFSFDVNGSATGRIFDLYTGSSISSLAPAGVKVGGGRGGHIYLVATAGATYVIRLDDQFNPADWVLNWSDGVSAAGPDTTPPESNPTLATANTLGWSNDNTVDVTWSGASDSGSGVDGYSYEWSQSPTTVPDTTKEAEETASRTTSPPLADGQWWFHLRTGDNAGNWGAPVHLGPFKIDTTAPGNPTVASPSHGVGAWSADATVDTTWSGASDAASGVDGYSYEWSQTAATTPDATKDTSGTSASSAALADGSWWFHLRTVDGAGNWSGAVHLGPFRIDTAAPATPALSSTHPADWSADSTVDVSWSGATDSGSGVSGYSFAWSNDATTTPDQTQDTTGAGATSAPLADGSWWFHLRTRDNAGNWSSAVHLGPFKIDGTAPSSPALSSPTHTVDVWSNDPTVEIAWSGQADAHSGVDGFSFAWSQQSAGDPGTAKSSEETAAGTTSAPLADGSWWFHLRTRDNAGNWSAPVHLGPFKIDATPPSNPTLASPSHAVESWSPNPTVVVVWSGGDSAGGFSFEWSADAAAVPDTTRDLEASETTLSKHLDDGSWWFHLRALDAAGGWSGASHLGPFWIDTTAPGTTIDSAPAEETSERAAAFAFSSNETATSFSCSLDSGAYDDCVPPLFYPALSLGAHVFTVKARDRAGNVDQTPAEHRWTIVAAPAPPPPPPAPPPPPPSPPSPPPAPPPPSPPPPSPAPSPPPPPTPAPPPPPAPRQAQATRCVVPRLVGLRLTRVKTVLARAGCRLGRVTWMYSPRTPRGRVVSQRPHRGVRLRRGGRVAVTVSRGRAPPRP